MLRADVAALLVECFFMQTHLNCFYEFLAPMLWAVGLNVLDIAAAYAVFDLCFGVVSPLLCVLHDSSEDRREYVRRLRWTKPIVTLAIGLYLRKTRGNGAAAVAISLVVVGLLSSVASTDFSLIFSKALSLSKERYFIGTSVTYETFRKVVPLSIFASCATMLVACKTVSGSWYGNSFLSTPQTLTPEMSALNAAGALVFALLQAIACEYYFSAASRGGHYRQPAPVSSEKHFADLFRLADRPLLVLYAICATAGIATKVADNFTLIFLVDALEAPVPLLIAVFGIEGVASIIILNLPCGYTFPRIIRMLTRQYALAIAVLSAFSRVLCIAVFPNVGGALLSGVPCGISWTFFNYITMDLAHSLAPSRELTSTAVACSTAFYYGVGGVLGSLAGAVFQYFLGWRALYIGLAVMSLVASLLSIYFIRLTMVGGVSTLPEEFDDDCDDSRSSLRQEYRPLLSAEHLQTNDNLNPAPSLFSKLGAKTLPTREGGRVDENSALLSSRQERLV